MALDWVGIRCCLHLNVNNSGEDLALKYEWQHRVLFLLLNTQQDVNLQAVNEQND